MTLHRRMGLAGVTRRQAAQWLHAERVQGGSKRVHQIFGREVFSFIVKSTTFKLKHA